MVLPIHPRDLHPYHHLGLPLKPTLPHHNLNGRLPAPHRPPRPDNRHSPRDPLTHRPRCARMVRPHRRRRHRRRKRLHPRVSLTPLLQQRQRGAVRGGGAESSGGQSAPVRTGGRGGRGRPGDESDAQGAES